MSWVQLRRVGGAEVDARLLEGLRITIAPKGRGGET